MAISSNSLFHYTKSISAIQNIIEHGFSPSYCRESMAAVPMVSFCDIPLSQVKQHIDYGNYAIGMNMEWVKKNRLNPVYYVEESSQFGNTYMKAFSEAVKLYKRIDTLIDNREKQKELEDSVKLMIEGLVEVARYHKPYRGAFERSNGDINNDHKFYDEKEWRYVPATNTNGVEDLLTLKEYEEYRKLNKSKPHLKNIKLQMSCGDIEYIILNNKDEIPSFIKFLEDQSHLGSATETKLLTTRIITTKQIQNDF